MPSTYAHLYFGKRAESLLPDEFAEAVKNNHQLYNIGLHGPDILFYFDPLTVNPINERGYDMHDDPAKDFFIPAAEVYHTCENKSEALAYTAGFLCHFALDRMCHGYIEKKINSSLISHSELELEFDRYLIEKDGKQLFKTDLTEHIVPSLENARAIGLFFPEISTEQLLKSLKAMKFYNRMQNSSGLMRVIVNLALKVSGNTNSAGKLIFAKTPVKGCKDSNLRLEKLLNCALDFYSKLCQKYLDYLRGGKLPEELNATFGPDEYWKTIPVLTYEEEKAYAI